MGVVTPIAAFVADRGRGPANLHLWRLHATEARNATLPADDRPLPRRLIYTALVLVSLLAWMGIVELAILLVRTLSAAA